MAVNVVIDSSKLSSPSAGRRKILRNVADEASGKFQVLESCPLSKYMDVADRLLERFCAAADEERLDEAYVLGLRFASLCLSGLPQHPEWNNRTAAAEAEAGGDATTVASGGSGSGADRRAGLTSKTAVVLRKLAVLKRQMDAEEIAKLAVESIEREHSEARQQESEDLRRLALAEEREREKAICSALDRERAEFRASQRRTPPPHSSATMRRPVGRLQTVYSRIWSK